MTVASFTTPAGLLSVAGGCVSTGMARTLLVLAIFAAAISGFMATDAATAARAAGIAGSDLTRLLRAMAAIKALMGAAVGAAVFWRLALPVSVARLGLYTAGCAALAAAPALIWNMAEVAKGAILLHVGLALSLILLWRDPAVGRRLSDLIAWRRAGLRQRDRTEPDGRGPRRPSSAEPTSPGDQR